MCDFFSFVSNGRGRYFYLTAKQRKEIKDLNNGDNTDSHSFIVEYYQRKKKIEIGNTVEDKFNKYEYNFLTKKFTVDQINTKDDSEQAERFVKSLNVKDIVPKLVIKEIINPFELKKKRISKKRIKLLKQWASVRNSVCGSMCDFVCDSVCDSVGDFVCDSVCDSVCGSMWNYVTDSLWAYISSFFKIDKWKNIDHVPGENPFQSCIDLWEYGIVPTFVGNTWRLHSGKNVDVIYEIDKDKLKNLEI